VDECGSSPCNNSGTCQDMVDGYLCNCTSGYTGTACETDIDECISDPCLNNGTCQDAVNGYNCACKSGWDLP
jgi:hypothetical protein